MMSNIIQIKALTPNVGFLLKEAPGSLRSLEIDLAVVVWPDGFSVKSLEGKIGLMRTQQGIWVEGVLEGRMPAECARCLEPFSLLLQMDLQELFFYPPSSASDALEYVVGEDGVLDLTEPVREQLALSVPIQPLCRPDCRGLCSQCGQNLNQGECNCAEQDIDPRLADLLQLKERLAGE